MFRFVILTVLLALASAATIPFPDGKIVGGVPTTIEQHPYQVSLQRRGIHDCGGSLYKANIVVTAAHCLDDNIKAKYLTVRVGSTNKTTGGQVIKVKSYINHPDYNKDTDSNDVAVILLEKNAVLNSSVRTIELATTTPKTGTPAVVTGWGTEKFGVHVYPNNLREVELKIVDAQDCASSKYRYGKSINSSMVCAVGKGKDSCQADSGGPLVAENKLVGVVSWGHGCGFEGYPGVYADVAVFHSWIVDTANSI